MHSTKEIILRIPLLKSLRQNKINEQGNEKSNLPKEKENRLATENEWHQEYYLIYNSYVLDNGY